MSTSIERSGLQLGAPKTAPVTLSQFGVPQPMPQNNAGGLGVPQLGTPPTGTTGTDAGLLPESEVFLSQREISDLFGGGNRKLFSYRNGLLG